MIHVLYGENQYEVLRRAEYLMQTYEQQNGEGSLHKYSAEDITPADLPQVLQGQSLFSTATLTIILGASTNKSLWEAMGEFFEKNLEVDLILVEVKPDKRTRTFKWLQKNATVLECKPLTEQQLVTWLQNEARALGTDISKELASFLIQYVGGDQWALRSDLQKLVLTNKPISVETIKEFIEPHTEASVFELLDAILKGDSAATTAGIALLARSEDAYKFMGLLVSQLYTLTICAYAEDKSSQEITANFGLHPYVVQKTVGLTKRLRRSTIAKLIDIACSCDETLKSSANDPWEIVSLHLGRMVGEIKAAH